MRISVELPEGTQTYDLAASDGETLTQALRHKGLPLNTRCGERALCKACLVEVWRDGEWVQEHGCRLAPFEGLQVRIPPSALLAYAPQVQSEYRLGVPFALDPLYGRQGVALAVDIGTTTVAVLALDLADGAIVGRAAAFNRQIALGDDVLTRISLCLSDDAQTAELQRLLVQETLIPLAREALAEAGRAWDDVRGWTFAGNSTMLHLALGVNPRRMGAVPFTPEFLDMQETSTTALGLPGAGRVVTLPGSAAYVGADIVAGAIASGFAYDAHPSLFVDVGTNGEMVVRYEGRLVGCATAAGPAFEGSGLVCGMRAGRGAISHVRWEADRMAFDVIGGDAAGRPIGLCGSAYVDFLSQGHAAGIVSASGRLVPGHPNVRPGEYGLEYEVALGQGKRSIVIGDPDLARLLQAKAAVASGIQILLRRVGIAAQSIDSLVLAGGFGMHLDIPNAIACGLLPGFRPDQIELVGNTSLAGAVLATLDQGALESMRETALAIEVIELNQDPDFEDAYIDNLVLGDPWS